MDANRNIAHRPIILLAILVASCDSESTSTLSTTPAPPTPSAFDPSAVGTVQGQVTWQGHVPAVKPLAYYPIRMGLTPLLPEKKRFENPHAPRIDEATRGIHNAVVYLTGVDPAHAKTWKLPPVKVVMKDDQCQIEQGPDQSSIGFVRRGDKVEMVSRQSKFHFLQTDGAAFFGLPFPEPNQPLRRVFKKKGVVELSSAAGFFWMRSYLFVDDHPYYCKTDSKGRFTLREVPPGHYEVVCWLPNWHEKKRHYHPETGEVARLFYRAPVLLRQPVSVAPGEDKQVLFQYGESMFLDRSSDGQ